MQLWAKIMEIYKGEPLLVILLCIAAGVLVIAAISSYFLRATGVFAALASITFGVVGLLMLFGNIEKRAGFVSLASLLVFGGAIYLLLFGVLAVRKTVLERKLRRAEIARRLCYTLPDRENTYVRARLNTTLQVPKEEFNEYMGALEGVKKPIKLEHARQLLCKVKEAPLSKAERLQVEEMDKTFSLYLNKESWTATDLRAVNELCAAILKISAKYAV